MSFAGWLIMNRWLTVPEAPALHVLWHDGDGAIKRAVKAREYVVSEERVGRNVLVRAAETFSAEPWREAWWKTAESVTDALAHAKTVSGKSSRCAIMTTYVDDCDLDAAKPLRTLVWKVVRTLFAARDPVQMQKFLGAECEAWDSTSSCRGLRLNQSNYTAKILEDAVKLGFGPIRVCTTAGQSVTPPDPKLLPEQPCDPGVREVIGSLLFLSRCARFDILFVIARLARLVTRRYEWARTEIRQILVLHSALRVHLTLEVERVVVERILELQRELVHPWSSRPERSLAWNMDGYGLLAGEGGDVIIFIVWCCGAVPVSVSSSSPPSCGGAWTSGWWLCL